MIILSNTTDTIKAVLSGNVTTNQLQCFASYRDITTSTFNSDRSVILTNNTTAVNVVSAPSASTQRVIDYISIYNNDTVTQTVTVTLDANATGYRLYRVALLTLEKLEYNDTSGWVTINSSGAIKQTQTFGNNPVQPTFTTTVLASDVTNNNAVANTIQDITGLSFSVTSGLNYYYRFVIWYTAAATATGARFSINGPATTNLAYMSRYALTTTTETINHGLTAYDLPAASNVTSAATAGNLAIIEGVITPSANGTVIARFASEVSSSAIVAKAGSLVQFQQI
jgi:hypothetical protein